MPLLALRHSHPTSGNRPDLIDLPSFSSHPSLSKVSLAAGTNNVPSSLSIPSSATPVRTSPCRLRQTRKVPRRAGAPARSEVRDRTPDIRHVLFWEPHALWMMRGRALPGACLHRERIATRVTAYKYPLGSALAPRSIYQADSARYIWSSSRRLVNGMPVCRSGRRQRRAEACDLEAMNEIGEVSVGGVCC